MNFELNEQQLSIQKMARDFTEKKVAPKVLERDETREYDVNLYKDLCDMGFIGLPYAKEYGGQGLGYMEYALAVEEISKVDPSLGVSFSVATSLYGGSLYFSEATDEQLKRFMPPVLRDGHLGSFGLTEPTAGSDVSGMLTFAENDFTYKMSIPAGRRRVHHQRQQVLYHQRPPVRLLLRLRPHRPRAGAQEHRHLRGGEKYPGLYHRRPPQHHGHPQRHGQ